MSEVPGPSSTETNPPGVKNLEAFKALFPGVIQDGVLDAARLGELLDTDVAGLKNGKERFGLMWAGKGAAVEALQSPSMAALAPDTESSVNWDRAQNVFVEGDNLEVLKLIQNSYNDQVDLIYIDPPYNTGNDFVYSDDFSDPLKHYLEVTGQMDAEGNRLVANAETAGRKHSNWLTMMYPRLVLARNLLTQDGAIFVSIDDNEQHNLRVLLDEVFGAENFVTSFPWQSRPSMQNDTDVSISHEYLVCYARNRRKENRRLKESNADSWATDPSFVIQPLPTNNARYKLDDGDGRGPYKDDPFDAPNVRPNLTYEITNPNTGQTYLPPAGRHWRTTKEEFERYLADGRISWGASGAGSPKLKAYYSEKAAYGEVPGTWLSAELVGAAALGTKELQKIFNGEAPFDTPKPVSLMKKILQLGMKKSGLVLDFFAGSGSMGQAVLELNKEDGGERRFLLVNLDEKVQEGSAAERLGFSTVSEITIERLKKCNEIYDGFSGGLRVYRLGKSGFVTDSAVDVDGQLNLLSETVSPEATDLLLASQMLLSVGVPLGTEVSLSTLGESGYLKAGDYIAVIRRNLDQGYLDQILELSPKVLLMLEDAFAKSDSLKANLHFNAKKLSIKLQTF